MKGGAYILMNEIVFTLEFDDDIANTRANDYLQKGWKLLSVGTKMIDTLDNGQAYYNTAYVVGANEQQYSEYLEDEKNNPFDLL